VARIVSDGAPGADVDARGPRGADDVPSATMRFDTDDVALLRKGLLRQGGVLAQRLSDELAGKEHPPLTATGIATKPGMRPEEVLRLALDLVEARRVLLDAGDDAFGRCDVCGADLGLAALREMPWADRCAAHPLVITEST
jgi:hypothetical protein